MMRDIVPEHVIQKRIFNRLVGAKSLRYSELKPKEIEANLFMYHLKELMKMGLVEKADGGYQVSKKGGTIASRFSIREQGIRVMPSTISVVALRALDGEWCLYRRKRQPYIDALGFPSGKIHLGDALRDAAYRELDEKCGYTSDEVELTHKGVFNLVEIEPDHLRSHIIGFVWFGEVKEKRVFDNHAGETFWGDWHKENYAEFIPGFKEIIDGLASDDFFHFELYLDSSIQTD